MPRKLLGMGRNRMGILSKSGRYVYKFPLNQEGVTDNEFEHRYCLEQDNNRLAKCRFSKSGILVMEYLRPISDSDYTSKEDDNFIMCVDCGQVGFDRHNNLKAYDYA